MSILSFPDRGPWGDARYRGNCSGHVYKALFEQLRPESFCDPMMGSGTSIEVAQEMGIKAHGLDLRLGFNALRQSILQAIGGEAVDLVLSHPPYGDMIRYSSAVYGDTPIPDDLSWCESDQDFHEKLQRVLLNQREATRAGGHYGTIIGDLRRKGRYVSYQAEAIARMPADELVAVQIKAQHNVMSDSRSYARMPYMRVQHEYILLWQKRERTVYALLKGMATTAAGRLRATWTAIVHMAMVSLGGKASLAELYAAVKSSAPQANLESNSNVEAKVRQVLQLNSDLFRRESSGVWGLADPEPVMRKAA